MERKEMIEVFIDMDTTWAFIPFPRNTESDSRSGSMEISRDLFDRYDAALHEYQQVTAEIEQLYRVQQGLQPFSSPLVPDHKILK